MRYSILRSFFNFIKNTINPDIQNPCDTPALKKLFKAPKQSQWTIFEKEIVDELIFKSQNQRNRIMLELMARGGMRVGEVLEMRPCDIEDRKVTLHDPKSGKLIEFVFIPQKVADRLQNYIRAKQISPNDKIFSITYSGARKMIKKLGTTVGINIKSHDLRRHAATYASRSGVPIEIISKVILRHASLSTTQRYLGKVSDTEAMRWIDSIHN